MHSLLQAPTVTEVFSSSDQEADALFEDSESNLLDVAGTSSLALFLFTLSREMFLF